jgi:hypothetical protein
MKELIDRRSKSLWMDIAVAPSATPLQGDNECDVVIIGAGIAGISTAYELAIEGSHVIVLDRGKIAGGMTARTSAHLAPLCDDLTSAMVGLRGEEISRRFYESQAAAVDRIEEIQTRESIDCDFRRLDGYLFQALNTDSKIIEDELDAVRKVGAPSIGWSACPSPTASSSMCCAIRAKRRFIRSNISKVLSLLSRQRAATSTATRWSSASKSATTARSLSRPATGR